MVHAGQDLPCSSCDTDECRQAHMSYTYLMPFVNFMAQRRYQVNSLLDWDGKEVTVCSRGNGDQDVTNKYINNFFYTGKLANCDNPVVRPNVDDIYVMGWVDLSYGPVEISWPSMEFTSGSSEGNGADYCIQFVSPWTDSYYHIGSYGDADQGNYTGSGTGDYSAGTAYIYWSGDENQLDFYEQEKDELTLIESEFKWTWVVSRISIPYGDVTATNELCDQFCMSAQLWDGSKLVPIDGTTVFYDPTPVPTDFYTDLTCSGLSTYLANPENAIRYLDFAAEGLSNISIPEGIRNAFYAYEASQIGVDAKTGGPSYADLSDTQIQQVAEGVLGASTLYCSNSSSGGIDQSCLDTIQKSSGSWTVPPASVGDFGQYFLLRAYVAQIGLGADTRTFEYYPTAYNFVPEVGEASAFDASETYYICLDDSIDDVSSSWSITMYKGSQGSAQLLCPDENNSCVGCSDDPSDDGNTQIYATGNKHLPWVDGAISTTAQGAIPRHDGNYYIQVSPDPPANDDPSDLTTYTNWLPSSSISDSDGNPFSLTLRVFNADIDSSGNFTNNWEVPRISQADLPAIGICPATSSGCEGDFTNNNVVNAADFGALLQKWGDCSGCPEDLTEDGVVDGADVVLLLGFWGSCP